MVARTITNKTLRDQGIEWVQLYFEQYSDSDKPNRMCVRICWLKGEDKYEAKGMFLEEAAGDVDVISRYFGGWVYERLKARITFRYEKAEKSGAWDKKTLQRLLLDSVPPGAKINHLEI